MIQQNVYPILRKSLHFLTLNCAFYLLSSCESSMLSVHSDYLSHENLASYHVNTPDPLQNDPPIGQRLIISWSVPDMYLDCAHVQLDITVRFRNHEEVKMAVDLLKNRGTYVYALMNEFYRETEGILTYKVELVADGNIIEEWRHQIWANLIVIAHEPCHETESAQDEQVDDSFDF